MLIKLLGGNENGFPIDCTIGKVYEVKSIDVYGCSWFYDDKGDRNYAFDCEGFDIPVGEWQVVDKNGEAV